MNVIRIKHSLALLLCLFLSAPAFLFYGCAGEKVKTPAKPEYQEVLGRWTRGKKIFEGLEARLYISATYKDISFREAYVEKYSKGYQLDPDYAKVLMEREAGLSEQYNEFFFSAYTPEERWNDFDQKDSAWHIYLEDDSGVRLMPMSVKRVDSSDPLIREFFPYLDLWGRGYVVRFPKYGASAAGPIPNQETKFIKLIVTGVLGKGELEWRLKN